MLAADRDDLFKQKWQAELYRRSTELLRDHHKSEAESAARQAAQLRRQKAAEMAAEQRAKKMEADRLAQVQREQERAAAARSKKSKKKTVARSSKSAASAKSSQTSPPLADDVATAVAELAQQDEAREQAARRQEAISRQDLEAVLLREQLLDAAASQTINADWTLTPRDDTPLDGWKCNRCARINSLSQRRCKVCN
eukprot:SAG31_NODE_11639_length_1011_cov_0.850877_1_plen_196_part_10